MQHPMEAPPGSCLSDPWASDKEWENAQAAAPTIELATTISAIYLRMRTRLAFGSNFEPTWDTACCFGARKDDRKSAGGGCQPTKSPSGHSLLGLQGRPTAADQASGWDIIRAQEPRSLSDFQSGYACMAWKRLLHTQNNGSDSLRGEHKQTHRNGLLYHQKPRHVIVLREPTVYLQRG
jgi:hypothetical protein